jgi:hypothetical protein
MLRLHSHRSELLGRFARRFRRLLAGVGLLLILALGGMPNRASGAVAQAVRIYLYVPGNSPTEVTASYYVDGGQGYIGPNDTFPVVLNYEDDHVYDLSGAIIGYIDPGAPPDDPE